MHTLTLRIYLTVVTVLLLFAFGAGWLFKRQVEHERSRADAIVAERVAAWGDLIEQSLPGAGAPPEEQAAAVQAWSHRLRLPMALDDSRGERIATSETFERRQNEVGQARAKTPIRLDDGRTLWIIRPGLLRQARLNARGDPLPTVSPADGWREVFGKRGWPPGSGLALVLVVLFIAVAAGAWPAVRRLTRRLNALKRGVEQFGAGELGHRVDVSGRDEVAAVATSFNQAAARVEALVRSHKSLLANASHELRSPLARLKMAVSMLGDGASPSPREEKLLHEINTNVAELDALVEEVLLASRLDAAQRELACEAVDLLALAAEEGARVDATVEGTALMVAGDERLLRRALRNLLENAKRYGGGDVSVRVEARGQDVAVCVCDRGPGVPPALRERIFEAFYRLPGHAEQAGGVGLGLSLVKQIAEKHGGRVRCLDREGGGSCFELSVPASPPRSR